MQLSHLLFFLMVPSLLLQADEKPKAGHLVILVHGYNGDKNDLIHVEKSLLSLAASRDTRVEVLRINVDDTHIGIEYGARKIFAQVKDHLEHHKELNQISIVAHSLGGLYSRFLIYLLDESGIFRHLTPQSFITLATPHLGIRRRGDSLFNRFFHEVARRIDSTIIELMLEDDEKNPLLSQMCNQPFIMALNKFAHRAAYANIRNDFQITFRSASISPENPYNNQAISSASDHNFPSLTAWSLANVQNRLIQPPFLNESNLDEKEALIQNMFAILNTMTWERYDASFSTLFAHEQIICKRGQQFSGCDIPKHLAGLLLSSR